MALETNDLHRDDVGGRLIGEVLVRVPGSGLCLASLVDEVLGDVQCGPAGLPLLGADDLGSLRGSGGDCPGHCDEIECHKKNRIGLSTWITILEERGCGLILRAALFDEIWGWQFMSMAGHDHVFTPRGILDAQVVLVCRFAISGSRPYHHHHPSFAE